MRLCLFVFLSVALLSAGCGKKVSATFSSVATNLGNGSIPPASTGLANPVKIELESSPLALQKGKTAKLTITANRKSTKAEPIYQGEIKLEFDTSDAQGITVEPPTAVIPAGKDSVEVTVKAAKDAQEGFIEIKGKGTGTEPGVMRIRPTVR